MTTVTYNEVTIQNCLTEDIDQKMEMDKTGTDPLYIRTTIRVSGILSIQQSSTLGIAPTGNLAATFKDVYKKLAEPKKRFTMTIDGNTLFDVQAGSSAPNAAGLNMDVHHGPKPSFSVTGIQGSYSMRIVFTVELCTPNCSGTTNGVLNLRFWIADQISGKDALTLRTYHGRLRVAHNKLNPHAFRGWCVPPLQPGFQRERISFQGSEDGLELEFTIEDQEVYAAAPRPALRWGGNHSVMSPQPGGMVCDSEVRVWATSDKRTSKTLLLQLVTNIVDSKLHILDALANKNLMLIFAAYNDTFEENRVELTVRIKHTGDELSLFNIVGRDLGFPLRLANYNKEVSRAVVPTGSVAGLFLCELQSPCSPNTMPQTGSYPLQLVETSPGDGTTVTYTDQALQSYESKYSQSHKQAIYFAYEVTSDYDFDEGLAALPVGKLSPGSDTATVIVPLYHPQARRHVRLHAERLDASPELPAPIAFTDEHGITHTPLRTRPIPHAPQMSADGRKTLYAVDYEIYYALSRRPKPTESLRIGKIPCRVGTSTELVKLMPSTYQTPTSSAETSII